MSNEILFLFDVSEAIKILEELGEEVTRSNIDRLQSSGSCLTKVKVGLPENLQEVGVMLGTDDDDLAETIRV